jgi:hypothetical protein
MNIVEPSFDPLEERVLRRIPFAILGLSALGGAAAALIFDALTGAIFFAGGALAALSFLWLKHALNRVLGRGKKGALRAGIALYALRFALILGVFLLIILAYPGKILAFAAGFSTVIPVFIVEAAVAFARLKQWKV